MGDSLMTVIAIVLAAILMFGFSLQQVSEMHDKEASLVAETAANEFVNEAATTGLITIESYDKLIQKLGATGNSYEVEIEVRKLDENPGKKSAMVETNKVGENLYYSVYFSQLAPELDSKGKILLKEGDIVVVRIKNTNQTIAQMLRNFFYNISGSETSQIRVELSGLVMANGK